MRIASKSLRTVTVAAFVLTILSAASAQYGGGAGTPEDPYQIWTPEQMNAIGAEPNAWDKHFKLMADIDLSAYDGKDGRPAFNIIAADVSAMKSGSQQDLFSGVFDGNGHKISNFTHTSSDRYRYAGLFGYVGGPRGEIRNLGLIDATVEVGDGFSVGVLAGTNTSVMIHCYTTGSVSGTRHCVGGLAGYNYGAVIGCYSTVSVGGDGSSAGGLVGLNDEGTVVHCYASGPVSGKSRVGGLVGDIGDGNLIHCYSTGAVSSAGGSTGGLVGAEFSTIIGGIVMGCFWDTQTSGQTKSSGGVGLTTALMHEIETYSQAGWDWLDRMEDGTSDVWQMPEGGGYPVLSFFQGHVAEEMQGHGTPDDPYVISDASDLGTMVHRSPHAHYRLGDSIDLTGICWGAAPIPWFGGMFDGDAQRISHLTIVGDGHLGLFGHLAHGGEIRNLAVEDANVTGESRYVSALVARNDGIVVRCYSTGSVSAGWESGGLVGYNGSWSAVNQCYSDVAVSGRWALGGLVGSNRGTVTHCYYRTPVTDIDQGPAGGLIGTNWGTVLGCFGPSRAQRPSRPAMGGGESPPAGTVPPIVTRDRQAYLDAGWDWVGETANGTCEVWQMPEGADYPLLTIFSGYTPPQLQGRGTPEEPYLISDAMELGATAYYSPSACFRLVAPIDLSGIRWATPVISTLGGTFDGNNRTISNLTIEGGGLLGLFGQLVGGAEVADLGVVDANIIGSHEHVGGLVGLNRQGRVTRCHSSGAIKGTRHVGGLAGYNWWGDATDCNTAVTVSGTEEIGGLLGYNTGMVIGCQSDGAVSGEESVGGLIGLNVGSLDRCYNTATVDANEDVGGLIGTTWEGGIAHCYNTGAVSGLYRVGGLVGSSGRGWSALSYWQPSTVIHCDSTGPVSGHTDVGGLMGANSGDTLHSYSSGPVRGGTSVGGLVGYNGGNVVDCHSSSEVTADGNDVGGLVGANSWGDIATSCSSGMVTADGNNVGGLVGESLVGNLTDCYSTSTITGRDYVGGLIGIDWSVLYYSETPDDGTLYSGTVSRCHFAGAVSGRESVGGIVGAPGGTFISCFWDRQVSGLTKMCGEPDPWSTGCDDGSGKMTTEMQTASTFLGASWDFVGETANGTEDIWWILEGQDYPRLWWEAAEE